MRNPAFNKVIEEVLGLHDKKNTDYGRTDDPLANLTGCTRLGLDPVMGIIIRLQDKQSRIENFCRNGKLVNESLRDAFIDQAIYSLLAVTIIDREGSKKDELDRLKQAAGKFIQAPVAASNKPESKKVRDTPSTFKPESRIEEEDRRASERIGFPPGRREIDLAKFKEKIKL